VREIEREISVAQAPPPVSQQTKVDPGKTSQDAPLERSKSVGAKATGPKFTTIQTFGWDQVEGVAIIARKSRECFWLISITTSIVVSSLWWFGQGEYNSPWVTVYVSLDGVGQAKDRVDCKFGNNSFDLQVGKGVGGQGIKCPMTTVMVISKLVFSDGGNQVVDLNGTSYRLLNENLDKDIVPGDSKIVVKKDQIKIQLKKVWN